MLIVFVDALAPVLIVAGILGEVCLTGGALGVFVLGAQGLAAVMCLCAHVAVGVVGIFVPLLGRHTAVGVANCKQNAVAVFVIDRQLLLSAVIGHDLAAADGTGIVFQRVGRGVEDLFTFAADMPVVLQIAFPAPFGGMGVAAGRQHREHQGADRVREKVFSFHSCIPFRMMDGGRLPLLCFVRRVIMAGVPTMTVGSPTVASSTPFLSCFILLQAFQKTRGAARDV